MECAQCGAVLKDGQESCASCGARIGSPEMSVTDTEIHRLLAEANLCRIRKQYDEAISLCTRVLRLDSANATAHALMGDVHRDQGNYREALGWFKLAVQLNPANAADRKKLDDVIDRVFKETVQGDGMPEMVSVEHIHARRPKVPRVNLQAVLERVTPVHIVVSFTVLALIVFSAFALTDWKGGARETPQTSVETRQDAAPTAATPANPSGPLMPGVTPPAPDAVEGGDTGIPGLHVEPGDSGKTSKSGNAKKSSSPTASSEGSVSNQVPPFDPPVRDQMSADELEKQTQALRTAMDENLKASKLPSTLDSVTLDPRTNVLSITYTIPPMKSPMETKQGLLYTGFNLVWAAEKVNGHIKTYALHGNATPEGGKSASLALIADVSPQQAEDAREAGDYKTVSKFLSNIWWRNDLGAAPL